MQSWEDLPSQCCRNVAVWGPCYSSSFAYHCCSGRVRALVSIPVISRRRRPWEPPLLMQFRAKQVCGMRRKIWKTFLLPSKWFCTLKWKKIISVTETELTFYFPSPSGPSEENGGTNCMGDIWELRGCRCEMGFFFSFNRFKTWVTVRQFLICSASQHSKLIWTSHY